jgi:hypothetical protein
MPASICYSKWLRGQDSNLRPRGYEPRELPLLHPATNGLAIVANRGGYVNARLSFGRSGGVGKSRPRTGSCAGRPVAWPWSQYQVSPGLAD